MKLRNKKTREIGTTRVDYQELYVDTENGYTYCYKSLQAMCDEWEDYEEPKEYYWYIDDLGIVSIDRVESSTIAMRKNFGNYFATREEAEKAVEKLKTWKRLKDKCNISFSGLNRNIKGRPVSVNLDFNIEGRTTFDEAIQNTKDLMLLFGGEDGE